MNTIIYEDAKMVANEVQDSLQKAYGFSELKRIIGSFIANFKS